MRVKDLLSLSECAKRELLDVLVISFGNATTYLALFPCVSGIGTGIIEACFQAVTTRVGAR